MPLGTIRLELLPARFSIPLLPDASELSWGSYIPGMAWKVKFNSLLVQDRARLQLIALALAGKKMASGGFEKVIKMVNWQKHATQSLADFYRIATTSPQKHTGVVPDVHFSNACTCFNRARSHVERA